MTDIDLSFPAHWFSGPRVTTSVIFWVTVLPACVVYVGMATHWDRESFDVLGVGVLFRETNAPIRSKAQKTIGYTTRARSPPWGRDRAHVDGTWIAHACTTPPRSRNTAGRGGFLGASDDQ